MAKFQKNKGLYLQLAIFVLMSVYVHTEDVCEVENEIEPIKLHLLGKGNFFDDMNDLKNNEKTVIEKDDLDELLKAVTVKNALYQLKLAGSDTQKLLKKQIDEEAEAAIDEESRSPNRAGGKGRDYYDYKICPYVRTWLKPGHYYFRFKEVIESCIKHKYCFNYWYIDFVCCQTKRCLTDDCPFPIFDRNSECHEEERSVNVPFFCYNLEVCEGYSFGYWEGIIEFKRISLTSKCFCRKRSSYVNDDKCPNE